MMKPRECTRGKAEVTRLPRRICITRVNTGLGRKLHNGAGEKSEKSYEKLRNWLRLPRPMSNGGRSRNEMRSSRTCKRKEEKKTKKRKAREKNKKGGQRAAAAPRTIGPFTKEPYNSHNYVNLSSSLCTLLAKSTAPSSLQLLVSTQDYVHSDVIGKVEGWRAAKSFRRCLLPPW